MRSEEKLHSLRIMFTELLILITGVNLIRSIEYSASTFICNPDVAVVGTQIAAVRATKPRHCATTCQQLPSCTAFQIVTSTNTDCFFFNNFTSFVYNSSSSACLISVYGFTLLPGSSAFYHADGTLYMFNTVTQINARKAMTVCHSTLGFTQLLAKKISQYNFIKQKQSTTHPGRYALGLLRNPVTGAVYWEDGTPYSQTEVSQVDPLLNNNGAAVDSYALINGIYDDMFLDGSTAMPLCQGNPFNVTI